MAFSDSPGSSTGSVGRSGAFSDASPSFGQGMGQGQLGQMFANLFAQQQANAQLAPQTMPALQIPATVGGRPTALAQQSNPTNQWGALPIILGTMYEVAYVSSGLFMSFRTGDNHNDTYIGYAFGYGPLEISDVKVGDIPIGDLDATAAPGRPSIEYQLVQTAEDDAQTLIEQDTHTNFVNKPMAYNERLIQVVPQDANLVTIAVQFPNGLYKNTIVIDYDTIEDPENPGEYIDVPSGSHVERTATTVAFSIEYRLAYSEDDWEVEEANWSVNKEIDEPLLINYEWEPPEQDHWEVRLKRKTDVGDGTDWVNDCIWYSLAGILTENPPYPAPPIGADGEPCTVGGIFIKVKADDQQPALLDPVNAQVSSLIPIFRDNLGLVSGIYPIDDRPDDIILDSSGEDNHAIANTGSGGTWIAGPRLRFNGTTTIAAPIAIDLTTVASYSFEGFIIPRGPLGNIPEPDAQVVFFAGDAGIIKYNPDTETITATIGGDVVLSVSITGEVLSELKFVLDVTSDTTDLSATLNVYEDVNLLGADSDTRAIAGTANEVELLIGGDGTEDGDYFLGQIFDVGIDVDSVNVGQYVIDDETARYPSDGDIRDTSSYGRSGFVALGATGNWSEESPSHLNFANSASIDLPFAMLAPDTNTLKIVGFINTNRGGSPGKARTAKNPILWQEDVFHLYHYPKTASLELSLGTSRAARARTPNKVVKDGAVLRFELFLECTPGGGTDVDVVGTINIYNELDELIATDATDTRTLDEFVFENIAIGKNPDQKLFYDGQIWNLSFLIDDVLVAEYPIDDNAVYFSSEGLIADTSGFEQPGELTIGATGSWTETDPPRLNFGNTATIKLPFTTSMIETTTTSFNIEGWFKPNRAASGRKSQNKINPILYQKDLLTVYHDPRKKQLAVGVGTGDRADMLTATNLIIDSEIYRFTIEMDCELDAGNIVDVDITLKVYNSTPTLISTVTKSTSLDVSKVGDLLVGQNTRSKVFFDGQIWDLSFEVDGVVVAEYPINDKPPAVVSNKKTEIFDITGQGNHARVYPFGSGTPVWTTTEPYRLAFDNNAWIRVPIPFDTNEAQTIAIDIRFISDDDVDPNPILLADFGGLIYVDGEDIVYSYDQGAEPFELRIEDVVPSGVARHVYFGLTPHNDVLEPYVSASLRITDIDEIDLGVDYGDIPVPTETDNLYTLVYRLATDTVTAFRGQIWDAAFYIQNTQFLETPAISSNPALQCLYLMRSKSFNPKPVPDSLIDFHGFYEWMTACDTLEYRFNAIVDQKVILWNLIQDVAKSGRAKIVKKAGQYTPAMDISMTITEKTPVQQFNRFNSTGFRYRNGKSIKLHAARVNFLDPLNHFEQTQVTVYNEGYSSANATKYEIINYYGCTRKLLAQRYGRHYIADKELRSKEYELTTDWEALVCAVGDLVYVSHDAALIGATGGRILSKTIESGFVTSITVDRGCIFETGKDYAVRMRNAELTTSVVSVDNPGDGVFYELTFTEPIPEANLELTGAGNLFQFGEEDTEAKIMFVKLIDRLPDHGARLILFEYNEGVYEFEAEFANGLPEFSSTARVIPQYRFVPPVPVIDSVTADGPTADVVLETISLDDVKFLMVSYREEGSDDVYIVKTAPPSDGSPTTINITGLTAATTYEVRARSISHASVVSDWCDLETVEIS